MTKAMVFILMMTFLEDVYASCLKIAPPQPSTPIVCKNAGFDFGFLITIYDGTEGEHCGYIESKAINGGYTISSVKIENSSDKAVGYLPKSVSEFFAYFPKLKVTTQTIEESSSKFNDRFSLNIVLRAVNSEQEKPNGLLMMAKDSSPSTPHAQMYCNINFPKVQAWLSQLK